MRATSRTALLIALVATLGCSFAAGSALASEGTGWELFANSDPTNFTQGTNEVQEVTVSPEASTFTLSYENSETGPIAKSASAAEVQSALEALSSIGTGNVTVATPGSEKFVVTFVNALGNLRTARLAAEGAEIAVTTRGAASGTIVVNVFNVGARASSGTVTVTDKLPPGIKAKVAGDLEATGSEANFGIAPTLSQADWACSGNGPAPAPSVAGATEVTCATNTSFAGGGGTMTYSQAAQHKYPPIGIAVETDESAPEGVKQDAEANHVTISGGEAAGPAETTDPVTISKELPKEGIVHADAWFSNADGTTDLQAGSHPYEAAFAFSAATATPRNPPAHAHIVGSEIRDLETKMPPGLVGDLHRLPQCTRQQLTSAAPFCPPGSMVGRLTIKTLAFNSTVTDQVFNMVPTNGAPAELGFFFEGSVFISFTVNSGGDYSLTAHIDNIPSKEAYESILVLWGAPDDHSHDPWRYLEGGCGEGSGKQEMEGPLYDGNEINYCRRPTTPVPTPILRMPTSCTGQPLSFAFREASGWQKPAATSEAAFKSHDATGAPSALTGCQLLGLEEAGFTAAPESSQADSPSGLTATITPALGGLEEVNALAPPDLGTVKVTLPQGVTVNPGQATSLQACPDGRPSPGHFANALTTPEEAGLGTEDIAPASCPFASKLGTVIIKSPAIEADPEKQFEGDVYLLPSNPPDIRLLVAASADGVNLKLVGTAHLNSETGQIETSFQNTPQLPFSEFKVTFDGGAKAALATPAHCASYTTSADFTPWNTPLSADVGASSAFAITEGAFGTGCPGSTLPFAPALTAGSVNTEAGAFAPFVMHLTRGDGQQRVSTVSFKAPQGLSAIIAGVPECDEADANAGTCPASSKLGHAVVQAGPGGNPLTLPQPGEPEIPIYLTGPYEGAPFGLSIVTPAIAGPFNLGNIITRARINVDPATGQITVPTDPLPQIVKGVPTDIRSIEAVIDRPDFMFNPTNCTPQTFTGTAAGTSPVGAAGEPGQTAAISSPFDVGGCRGLEFHPKFSASSAGRASKANGASLDVKVVASGGPHPGGGGEANIRSVKVSLPKQLPSRLTTLQKACLAAVFEANPAACPKESNVGTATAKTPVLAGPLTGPAYFVSHGNEAFPQLVVVLQGEGITVDLVGDTFISKAGITSSTFAHVPDVPVSSFELTLPQGKYSALAANGNLCKSKLTMPTLFVAQNGAEVKQSTKISVTGCPKAHKAKKKKRKHHRATKKAKGHK